MKLFLLAMAFISLNAFAQGSDKGGHDGSGGNICFVKDFTHCTGGRCKTFTGYRLVEEIQYPQFAQLPSMVKYNPTPLNIVKSEINEEVSYTDLTQTVAGRRARNDIIRALSFDLDLTAHVLELFSILKMSYVVTKRFGIAYEAGLEVRSRCEPSSIEAAIRTNSQGVVILSQNAWNKLPIESQKALLIHETFRFAQLYTHWFKEVSNQELQRVTMLVLKRKYSNLNKHSFYRSFKKEDSFYRVLWANDLRALMNEACSNFELECEQESFSRKLSKENVLHAYSFTAQISLEERDYATTIQKLLGRARLLSSPHSYKNERYESRELNKLRVHSSVYRSDIEQKILDEFSVK